MAQPVLVVGLVELCPLQAVVPPGLAVPVVLVAGPEQARVVLVLVRWVPGVGLALH